MKRRLVVLSAAVGIAAVLFSARESRRIEQPASPGAKPSAAPSASPPRQSNFPMALTNSPPRIAEEPIPFAADLEEATQLVADFDREFEARGWQSKANAGQLNEAEKAELLGLLSRRNSLLERKLDLAGY